LGLLRANKSYGFILSRMSVPVNYSVRYLIRISASGTHRAAVSFFHSLLSPVECRYRHITLAETSSADVLFHCLRPVIARATYLSFATRRGSRDRFASRCTSVHISTPAQSSMMFRSSFRCCASSPNFSLGSRLSTRYVEFL